LLFCKYIENCRLVSCTLKHPWRSQDDENLRTTLMLRCVFSTQFEYLRKRAIDNIFSESLRNYLSGAASNPVSALGHFGIFSSPRHTLSNCCDIWMYSDCLHNVINTNCFMCCYFSYDAVFCFLLLFIFSTLYMHARDWGRVSKFNWKLF